MSAQLIRLEAEGAWFGLSVELEGRTFRFDFRWNNRTGQWVLDVFDGGGQELVRGVVAVINVPLLAKFGPRADLPAGVLMLIDSSGADVDAGLADLGSRVELYYLPAAEVP